MKTIEEKAKAYDEAIKRAMALIKVATNQDEVMDFTNTIFPEFKGSVDEDSKKWILEYLYDGLRKSDEQFKCQFKTAIDWLEKQCQMFTKKDVDDAYLKGVTNTKNEIEKQYEANYQIRKDIATFIFNYKGDIKDRAKWIDYLGINISFVEGQDKQKHVFEMKTPEESLGIDSNTYNEIVDECIYSEQKPFSQREECLDCQFNYVGECKGSCEMKNDKQKPNPYSGVSFEYNGHIWGMCARDNGVEIIFDGELKAFLSSEKSFIYPIHPLPELTPKSALEAAKEENVEPKFKYGDRVRNKKSGLEQTLGGCVEDVYEGAFPFRIKDQDDWELIEQKPVENKQETKPNGGIVYEDFNEGDGYYKMNLEYLNKSQVELIEYLVDSWQNTANNTAKWSEEDDNRLHSIYHYLRILKDESDDDSVKKNIEKHINWLSKLYQNFLASQPKQEWNEEDENMLRRIFDSLNTYAKESYPILKSVVEEEIDWLKSLKLQKPFSKEDKERIKRITSFIWKNRKGDTDEIFQQEQDVKWLNSLIGEK